MAYETQFQSTRLYEARYCCWCSYIHTGFNPRRQCRAAGSVSIHATLPTTWSFQSVPPFGTTVFVTSRNEVSIHAVGFEIINPRQFQSMSLK